MVTGQRHRRRCRLDQLAKAGVPRQVAGLEHHEAGLGGQCQEITHGIAGAVTRVAHPHEPTATEQAEGLGLLHKPAARGAQLLTGELTDAERIAQIVDHLGRQSPRMLGHQTRIRAVEEHSRDVGVGSGEKALDRTGLEFHAAWFAK
jgi:hypothetical protein